MRLPAGATKQASSAGREVWLPPDKPVDPNGLDRILARPQLIWRSLNVPGAPSFFPVYKDFRTLLPAGIRQAFEAGM